MDTISKQAVVDAIAAVGEENGVCPCCTQSTVEAINALPAVSVTDDMVERAVKAWSGIRGSDGDIDAPMRAALIAALAD